MRRFFFDPGTRNGDVVMLSPEESKHATKVLRLQTGAEVLLFDGIGSVFSGIIETSKKRVQVRITGEKEAPACPDTPVEVYLGILKGEKMDMVVQKCTELGVATVRPFHSSRCQGKLAPAVAEKKLKRWQRIGREACKQCYRPELISIAPPLDYQELLAAKPQSSPEHQVQLLFWEEENEVHLYDVSDIRKATSIQLMLGPEGGFSREEVEVARANGWRTVGLGERILRAETATLTAVSIVQYLLKNL